MTLPLPDNIYPEIDCLSVVRCSRSLYCCVLIMFGIFPKLCNLHVNKSKNNLLFRQAHFFILSHRQMWTNIFLINYHFTLRKDFQFVFFLHNSNNLVKNSNFLFDIPNSNLFFENEKNCVKSYVNQRSIFTLELHFLTETKHQPENVTVLSVNSKLFVNGFSNVTILNMLRQSLIWQLE